MEVLPSHPVLKFNWKEVEEVRKECNMENVKHIRDGIQNIKEWYGMQPHMTKQHIAPEFIERVLVLSRGSVEAAKQKIDAIATVRSALPEFYTQRHVDCEEFANITQFVRPVPLPLLNKDLTRILFIRMGRSKSNPDLVFNPLTFFKFVMLINDSRMFIDYVAGDTYVLDMQHFKLSDFTNFSLGVLKKVQVITGAYSIKLKGIHFINAPSYIDKVVFILKQGLKDKIANRMQVHSSLEQFYKFVPRQLLPSDYGGDQLSLDELYEGWMSYLRSDTAKKQAEDANELKTDETKRAGGKVNEEMLGIPGSFRTLSVD